MTSRTIVCGCSLLALQTILVASTRAQAGPQSESTANSPATSSTPPSASAAPAPTANAANAPASTDIVVTAFKRATNLQKIPASVSAVSGEALAVQGITNARDLPKLIPNLILGEHFGQTLVTLRGVGSNVDNGAAQPTIATYVDGVYLPRSDMISVRPIDLDRVEVLRGPQGTLYGRNATGGAINFISQAPSKTFTGMVEAGAGSRSDRAFDGYFSVPLAEGVYIRMSGGVENQDGYVKVINTGQRLNGVDAKYGRVALRLEPTSNLKIDLAFKYDRSDAAVAYQQYFDTSALAGVPGVVYTTQPNRIAGEGPFSGYNQTMVASGIVNWTVSDHLTVKSTTGYVDHKAKDVTDADSTTLPIENVPGFIRPSKSESQEVTLLGDYDRFNFILGAYYFHENYKTVLPVDEPGIGLLKLGANSNIHNASLYADATYSLTNKLKLELGLRYNHESSGYQEVVSFVPVYPQQSEYLRDKSNKLLPKVALQYEFSPSVNGYIQWTRGYKSGGVNFPAAAPGFLPLFGPEKLDSYEAGLKTQFFNHALTANLAAFYYDYGGLQITTVVPPVGTAVQNANAKIYGVEGEFHANLGNHVTLSVSPTWLHPTFKQFSTIYPLSNETINLTGTQLPRAARFSVNGGVEGRIDLGGDLLHRLTLNANVVYTSKTILMYYNQTPEQSQPGYALVNLSASLTDIDDKTRLTAFVNNVGNKLYKQEITNFGLGYMGNYGPPRTWGIRLSRKL